MQHMGVWGCDDVGGGENERLKFTQLVGIWRGKRWARGSWLLFWA